MNRNRVPQLLVEQLAAGQLPADEAAEVRRRLEAEGGMDRLVSIAADNAETLAQHPPVGVAREVERRVKQLGARGASVVRFVPLVAVAAAALVWVGGPDVEPTSPEGAGITERIKGQAPTLRVYRKTADGAVPVVDGGTAAPGDRLQVGYVAAGRAYGVIFSVDGRGTVTLHHPTRASDPATLGSGGEVRLNHAFSLDDAPRHETFVLVVSDSPLDAADVLETAHATAGAGPFPGADGQPLDQARVVVRKESP